MPNVSDRKLKLLYLLQMLWEGTDSQHALTLPQMLEGLEARGIQAERKSLYDDLETLRQFGLPIATRKTRNFEYFLSERPFSQEELALLIDAVCSAGFLSRRRAAQLVKKVAALGKASGGCPAFCRWRRPNAAAFPRASASPARKKSLSFWRGAAAPRHGAGCAGGFPNERMVRHLPRHFKAGAKDSGGQSLAAEQARGCTASSGV